MLTRLSKGVRHILLSLAGSEVLFLFTAFLMVGVLNIDPLIWYQDILSSVHNYIIVPWGLALCLLRLERRRQRPDNGEPRMDILVLFVLWLYIALPFVWRFGYKFNNASAIQGYTTVFFGLYAITVESHSAYRERALSLCGMLFAALSFVLGGLLLYCTLTGTVFSADGYGLVFGVQDGFLYNGLHYNITGMVSLCCALLCLTAAGHAANPAAKAAYFIPALMMMVVVVLTQSRTARYALLIALAVGAYGTLSAKLYRQRAIIRQGVSLLCALILLVGGYLGTSALTDAALAHYARLSSAPQAALALPGTASALAEEADPTQFEPEVPAAEAPAMAQADQVTLKARQPVDSTFSDRTAIWKNLLAIWREDPKNLLIGHGIGQIGRQIVHGTTHEANGSVAVHNTYLQFIADYGLIGFALCCIFLVLAGRQAVRVFFAAGERSCPGGRGLCMVVIAALLTGLMESAPLGQMTPMNMVLFYALAHLSAMGRDLQLHDKAEKAAAHAAQA